MAFNKKFASVAGGFLLVIALVTSGFVIEDRYNNQNDHDKDIIHERQITEDKTAILESQIAMNLKEIQVQQQIANKQNDYRYYIGVFEDVDRKIEETQRKLNANPNDQNVRNDLQYYQQKKAKIRVKLDALMGN
jgi:multidrug efflux pump subunit AcrB